MTNRRTRNNTYGVLHLDKGLGGCATVVIMFDIRCGCALREARRGHVEIVENGGDMCGGEGVGLGSWCLLLVPLFWEAKEVHINAKASL